MRNSKKLTKLQKQVFFKWTPSFYPS
jgi:hypothetical protein